MLVLPLFSSAQRGWIRNLQLHRHSMRRQHSVSLSIDLEVVQAATIFAVHQNWYGEKYWFTLKFVKLDLFAIPRFPILDFWRTVTRNLNHDGSWIFRFQKMNSGDGRTWVWSEIEIVVQSEVCTRIGILSDCSWYLISDLQQSFWYAFELRKHYNDFIHRTIYRSWSHCWYRLAS